MSFVKFRDLVEHKLSAMAKGNTPLFVVDVPKDVIWDTYLNSFPEGTNNIVKERREYDCNCCKQFIRAVGNVVSINKKTNQLVSIWDVKPGGHFQPVVDALSALIKSGAVVDHFKYDGRIIGTKISHSYDKAAGKAVSYNHFHAETPANCLMSNKDIPSALGELRTNKEMLLRSLSEITLDSAQQVLELITSNSLYRGAEFKHIVEKFIKAKKAFDKIPADQADNYCWLESNDLGMGGRFRGTVIGTLLCDLSEGVELDKAVASFEAKVAPANYKRTTALITPQMVAAAQATVNSLGLEDSLYRRFASESDLTINNVLFASRPIKKAFGTVESLLSSATTSKPQASGKATDISVAEFVANILPKATDLSVLVENRMSSNLMSLIAPCVKNSPDILKWDNNFSWSYNGEVTDSIKERVKTAGGNVTGELRVSLAWHNTDDLDLSVVEPNGNRVYFGSRKGNTGCELDVDMNAYGKSDAYNPVENITWDNLKRMKEGEYSVYVNQFNKRMTDRVGYTVELEFRGSILTFNHPAAASGKKEVVRFKWSHAKGVEIVNSIGHTKMPKTIWGIQTETFVPVKMVMNSPNHWDGQQIGNHHLFFILEGCKNPEGTRGFYNEYLRDELHQHRKVFEVLAGKMKVEATDDQLSGVGFSSTQRNNVIVSVDGRAYNVQF